MGLESLKAAFDGLHMHFSVFSWTFITISSPFRINFVMSREPLHCADYTVSNIMVERMALSPTP